jgi:hypothetical protein
MAVANLLERLLAPICGFTGKLFLRLAQAKDNCVGAGFRFETDRVARPPMSGRVREKLEKRLDNQLRIVSSRAAA